MAMLILDAVLSFVIAMKKAATSSAIPAGRVPLARASAAVLRTGALCDLWSFGTLTGGYVSRWRQTLGEVLAHLLVNTATAVMKDALWLSLPLIGLLVRHPDEGGVVRRARGLSRPCPSTFAMTPPGLWLYDQCHT